MAEYEYKYKNEYIGDGWVQVYKYEYIGDGWVRVRVH